MAESFINDELLQQLARNEKLVETMLEHGADLDEPRPIDFFFFASTAADAKSLAGDLQALGFESAYIAEEEIEGKWAVQVVRNDTVADVTKEAFVEQLVRMAAKYLAEFDGWGTAV